MHNRPGTARVARVRPPIRKARKARTLEWSQEIDSDVSGRPVLS